MLEERFGDVFEVLKAHLKQMMGLPVIHGTSKHKINEFYDQLLSHVQALDTLRQASRHSSRPHENRRRLEKMEFSGPS